MFSLDIPLSYYSLVVCNSQMDFVSPILRGEAADKGSCDGGGCAERAWAKHDRDDSCYGFPSNDHPPFHTKSVYLLLRP